MALTLPLSDADATIVAAASLAGFNKASVVTSYLSWNAGVELAGQGSTLAIPVITRAAISDYDPSAGVSFSAVADTKVSCAMNQAKSWGKKLDITAINAGAGDYLSTLAAGAGSDLAYVVDQYALTTAVGAESGDGFVTGLGTDASPIDITAANAVFNIVAGIMVGLADKGEDLTIFASTYFIAQAMRDSRVVGTGQAQVQGRRILNLLGATIVETNAAPAGKIVAVSSRDAVVGGTSLNLTDTTYRPSPFVRTASGLCVFGAVAFREDAIAVATVE